MFRSFGKFWFRVQYRVFASLRKSTEVQTYCLIVSCNPFTDFLLWTPIERELHRGPDVTVGTKSSWTFVSCGERRPSMSLLAELFANRCAGAINILLLRSRSPVLLSTICKLDLVLDCLIVRTALQSGCESGPKRWAIL